MLVDVRRRVAKHRTGRDRHAPCQPVRQGLTVPSGVKAPIAVPNNAMLAEGVRRYRNSVLVDWHAASTGHPEFFWENDIHLTPQSARAYVDLISGHLGVP